MSSGHYGARRALKTMLETVVPERLELIRVAEGQDFLINPACYALVDAIPDDDANPRVLISSSQSEVKVATSSSPYDLRQYDYDLSVAVTAFENRNLTEEEASILRDQLLLAVREALLVKGQLRDGYSIVRASSGREEVGAAGVEDRNGRAISLGSIAVRVRSAETVADPTTVPIVEAETPVTTLPNP